MLGWGEVETKAEAEAEDEDETEEKIGRRAKKAKKMLKDSLVLPLVFFFIRYSQYFLTSSMYTLI